MTSTSPVMVAWGHAPMVAPSDPLRDEAAFRKATEPMLLAYKALSSLLAALPESCIATKSSWGIVIGVDHGELEVTREFLHTLHARDIARPMLFQSSLHNATLGFLSMHLGVHGPGFTTSTRYFSGEDALTLAQDLIAGGDCEACLAIGVEAIDGPMTAAVRAVVGPQIVPGGGAGAILLCSQAFATTNQLGAEAHRLVAIACERLPSSEQVPTRLDGYYGANAIEYLARSVLELGERSLRLLKPDGSHARIAVAKGLQ